MRTLQSSVKRASVVADRIRPPAPGLVILLYHRVGRRSLSRVDLPAWLFEEQMARLADRFRVLPLDEAIDTVESGNDEPYRVAVTFDDGTADFAEVAAPILERHAIPATLYVATSFVEDQRQFPQDGIPATWTSLRDVTATGLVTIGSHTHTHLLLDRAQPREAAEDLDRSIDLIGDRLGLVPRHFAYPKALLGSPSVQIEVRTRFLSAAVAGTRPNPFGRSDKYCLSRSPIQIEDGLHFFAIKATGGMRLEDDVRQFLNRHRFAGLTT